MGFMCREPGAVVIAGFRSKYNALWWAVKAPSPRYWISGNVRLDKVALCLAWSLLILLFYAYRYGMAARAILALLASIASLNCVVLMNQLLRGY